MRRSTTWRGIIVAGLLGLTTLALGATPARASGYCPPSCHYEWVITYVTRQVPYTEVVIRYDHCGRPYKVAKSCYETVRVPVKTRVLVVETR